MLLSCACSSLGGVLALGIDVQAAWYSIPWLDAALVFVHVHVPLVGLHLQAAVAAAAAAAGCIKHLMF